MSKKLKTLRLPGTSNDVTLCTNFRQLPMMDLCQMLKVLSKVSKQGFGCRMPFKINHLEFDEIKTKTFFSIFFANCDFQETTQRVSYCFSVVLQSKELYGLKS